MKKIILTLLLATRIIALDTSSQLAYNDFFSESKLSVVQGGSCTVDSDCSGKFYLCRTPKDPKHCETTSPCCLHKTPFQPTMYLSEYFGMLAFMIVMALCQVAGIGGGGLDEPLNMAFFKFNTKEAVGLSSFIILLCTICRTVYTFKARNPDKPNQVVVDYSLAVIMMPTTLAGSQIGVLVLHTSPAVVIQTLLTLTMALLAYQSYRKAKQIMKKEDEEKGLAFLREAEEKSIKSTVNKEETLISESMVGGEEFIINGKQFGDNNDPLRNRELIELSKLAL